MTQVPGYRSFGGAHSDTAALPGPVRKTKTLLRDRRRLFETEAPRALPRIFAIDEDLSGLRGRLVEALGAERAAIESLAKAAA